jgi:hypothetical protein
MPARIDWWLALVASTAVGLASANDVTPPDAGKGSPEKAFQ